MTGYIATILELDLNWEKDSQNTASPQKGIVNVGNQYINEFCQSFADALLWFDSGYK